MTFQQELGSWMFPSSLQTKSVPDVGTKAPTHTKLNPVRSDGRPMVITFLRHCGCPFAEKSFIQLRDLAKTNSDIHFVAVSHSDQSSTDKWLNELGGSGDVEMIIDHERELYAEWGLGTSSLLHVLSPTSLWSVYKLGRDEGINVRPTETGTRWQTAGSYAVNKEGIVTFSEPAQSAEQIADFNKAVKSTRDDTSKL